MLSVQSLVLSHRVLLINLRPGIGRRGLAKIGPITVNSMHHHTRDPWCLQNIPSGWVVKTRRWLPKAFVWIWTSSYHAIAVFLWYKREATTPCQDECLRTGEWYPCSWGLPKAERVIKTIQQNRSCVKSKISYEHQEHKSHKSRCS
jgi:hypothetical protein